MKQTQAATVPRAVAACILCVEFFATLVKLKSIVHTVRMSVMVRRASNGDIEWLCERLRAFSDAYGTRIKIFPDKNTAVTWLKQIIKSHLLLIAEDAPSKVRLGFIAGVLTPHLYNPEIMVLAELFWLVDPACRHGSAGLKLLDAFIEFGKDRADFVTFGTMMDTDVKDETLLKRGFVLKEKSFLMEVA